MDHPGQTGTETLIQQLAHDAFARPGRPRAFLPRLLLSTAVALLLAVGVVIVMFGVRADLATQVLTAMYVFKVLTMGCTVIVALVLVRAAGTPGAVLRPALLALPAGLLLTGLVMIDSTLPVTGARPTSALLCLTAIILAALPGLVVLLITLRRAAPTRPGLSGSAAGLLAGSLGALAYTLACVNDAAPFVAVWYSLAILATCLVGAMVGRRALRW